MRLGLTTPVITLVPRSHAAWETTAGRDDLLRIAGAADRLAYHHLSCSEHVAVPSAAAAVRGGRYYDPAAFLGFVAAVTTRIRLLTHVIVLPYHHPLEVAKRFGTVDALSDGRVILGVGVGSLEEEFRLLGVDFAGRGDLFEDSLRALRGVLGKREAAYRGTHYDFEGVVVDPVPVQARVPIWIGGRSARSLRRALQWADGWDPFLLDAEELTALLRRAAHWPEWHERAKPFDVALTPERTFDLTDDLQREAALRLWTRYRDLGASVLNLRFRSRSLEHYLDQLEICATEIAPELHSEP